MSIIERIGRLFLAFGFLAGLASLLGFIGVMWWPFEVLSHFRVQYILILTMSALLCVVMRRQFVLVAGFAVLVGLNLWVVAPYLILASSVTAGNRPVFTAVTLNVHTANKEYQRVRNSLLESNSDVFLLTEVDPIWLREMAPLEKTYPFVVSKPRLDNFGIAMYSRIQPLKADIVSLGSDELPSAFFQLEWQGKLLSILGTHPVPPRNSEYSFARNNQYDVIASFMAGIPGPKMVFGDLNATPWSFKFQELLSRTGLRDSAIGFGIQNTWPENVLAFRIPIDHALVSSHVQVIDRRVGEGVGSDHFPVKITFFLQDVAGEKASQ